MQKENIKQKLMKLGKEKCSIEDFINYEEEVLAEKDPDLSLWFAANVHGANIEEHERIICNTRDTSYMMSFANQVAGADIDTIGDYVIAFGCAREIYLYAKEFSKKDLDKYIDVLLNYTKDSNPITFIYVAELIELQKQVNANKTLKRVNN